MKNKYIYHYTTISGLIGIVSKHELWASECRFLNDGTELSYANDKFLTEVSKLNLQPIDDGGYVIPSGALDYFYMFVTCFCKEGDLLSQWRGYGEDQGYSLGFDLAKLKNLPVDDVIPVQYGIDNPSDYFANELESATHISAHPGNSMYFASQWFLPRIVKVKDPGFKEEKEWRILKQLTSSERHDEKYNDIIHFRASSRGPIPYITIPFPEDCLREIIIGPGPNSEICKLATNNLLNFFNFTNVNIRNTDIPYRK